MIIFTLMSLLIPVQHQLIFKELTIHACNFRHIPSSIPLAAYGWNMTLDETIFAVISNKGVNLITRFHLPKGLCIFYNRRLTTGNWKEDKKNPKNKKTKQNPKCQLVKAHLNVITAFCTSGFSKTPKRHVQTRTGRLVFCSCRANGKWEITGCVVNISFLL